MTYREYKLSFTNREYNDLVITYLNKSGANHHIPDNEKSKQEKRIDRIYEELVKYWCKY